MFNSIAESLQATRQTISLAEGFVPGSLDEKGANHFAARFTVPSDPARHVSIHVIVYNLFVPEPGRRTVKRSGQ